MRARVRLIIQVPLIPEITPTARSYTFRNVGDGLLFATQFTQVIFFVCCTFALNLLRFDCW